MPIHRVTFLLFLAIALPTAAWADDGVLEINQACAAGDGCFSGDSPGFPVEITASGSYVLTSGLDVPSATTGLDLSAGNVTVDLHGFAIIGPETCNNTPVTDCTGSTVALGISASSTNITVKNGKVQGFTSYGLSLNDRATVVGVRAEQNGSAGIFVGSDSLVADSQSLRNGGNGIFTGDRSIVRNSSAWGNAGHGIDTQQFCVVADSTSTENGDRGISTLSNNTIRGVSVTNNTDVGILLFNGDSVLTDSSVSDNTSFGVQCSFGGGSGLDNVVMNSNNSGGNQWDGTCNDVGGNLCSGNTTCP